MCAVSAAVATAAVATAACPPLASVSPSPSPTPSTLSLSPSPSLSVASAFDTAHALLSLSRAVCPEQIIIEKPRVASDWLAHPDNSRPLAAVKPASHPCSQYCSNHAVSLRGFSSSRMPSCLHCHFKKIKCSRADPVACVVRSIRCNYATPSSAHCSLPNQQQQQQLRSSKTARMCSEAPNLAWALRNGKSLTDLVIARLPALPVSNIAATASIVSQRRRLSCGMLWIVDPATRERVFVCPACSKEYRTANGLKYHLNTFCDDIEKFPQGWYWDRNCNNPNHDTSARIQDQPAKPFRCSFPECKHSYSSNGGLKYHMMHAHIQLRSNAEDVKGKEGRQ
ncbi:hypothetical protein HDU84_003579 [Entophlyctis sp. JEL0112]|nr:hypothetical protein HDU84_003579 [Entophlyctis sp. JEL0112]